MKEPLSHLEKKERLASSPGILSICLFTLLLLPLLLFWDQQVYLMNVRNKSSISRLRKMSSHPMTWVDLKWTRAQDFCKEAGIKKETTVPYNLQQNGHLRIFHCPVYFHVPKEKSTKLEALGKKGMIVGYCENSKAYKIYVSGKITTEFSKDITFDEDAALWKSKDTPPPANVKNKMMPWMHKKIPGPSFILLMNPWIPWAPWVLLHVLEGDLYGFVTPLQDVDKHDTPRGTFRESKKPWRFQGYVVAMSNIIQA